MTISLRQVWAIFHKDLLLEYRRRELIVSMLVFAVLILVVFNFAFDLRVESIRAVGPGILWVAIFFAGSLNIGRTIILERERGGWEGLILAPVEPGVLFTAKLVGNITFMLAMELALVPVFVALFDLPLLDGHILLVLALGTIGFAGVGTLFSALLSNSRAREVLMPVLLFPLLLPVMIAAVSATAERLDPGELVGRAPWTALLIAFDAIFVGGGYLLFDYILEE